MSFLDLFEVLAFVLFSFNLFFFLFSIALIFALVFENSFLLLTSNYYILLVISS